MDVLERIGVIAEIARRKHQRRHSPRLGKTTVMKMLYLLQEVFGVALGYRFTLYTYGPYQSDVMSDIDIAEAMAAVAIQYDNDQGYHISPGEQSDAFHCPKAAIAALNKVFDLFGNMNARDLELRSTILYLQSAVPPQKLVQNIGEIKPKFSKEEVEAAIEQLNSLRLLTPTRPIARAV